ncbi:molybdopterin-dependent oxidoreductase [Nocardioides sp. zg-ZUI104]|uniref:molybdopterin-dependent oxidoreductase n=1 Tax=Nocardioides faecalis TaxID=2803858 RepID=UPI001BD0699D|nr:molybdopterin-dependent oxidoreductase [Nocardioides faecalis]MBS4754469.1 molybdopterin-dependent oxidoreductase [Nocardioides faecalis]
MRTRRLVRSLRHLVWAAYGVLATLVGIGLAHAVAAFGDPATSPVLAVGSAVIDRTPTPMKEWAIRTFGSADKVVLVGSVMLGVLVLSALAGLLARRRPWLGAAGLLVLVALAAGAVLERPEVGALDLLPSLVAAITGPLTLLVLARLHRAATNPSAATDTAPTTEPSATAPTTDPSTTDTTSTKTPTSTSASRRHLLLGVGVATALAAVGGVTGRIVGRLRLRPEDVTLPAATDRAPTLPRGLDDQVDGITPFRTPNGDFYRVDTRLDVPILSADDWTLRIDGDVEREVTLTFDDLLEMDLVERDITLTCVSNSVGGPYVGGARWLGVRLVDVLALAGIANTKADQILSTDVDGMTISTPLEPATDGRDALIVVGMNGRALPREHGFPVRMVIPGLYGFVSATKWLRRLTLTTYAEREAYWTKRGWAKDAPIKTSARIDTPRALSKLDAGDVVVGGVAWAQARGGVTGVQVRIDGGEWFAARLGPEANDSYWRQWFVRWPAEPGSHRIAVRALAGDGSEQSGERAEPYPSGSSGLHELLVTVG